MRKRPLSVTVIGWMFIALGGIALVAGLLPPAQRLAEFEEYPFEFGLVQALRIIEVISGVFRFKATKKENCLILTSMSRTRR